MAKHGMLDAYTQRIKKFELDNSKNYISIGMNLSEIQEMNMLNGSEYKNIKQYALDEFGYESSKVYNLINVYNKFFKPDLNGSVNMKYYYYSFSQLVYMLTMTDEQLKICKPDMTVKQIKELKIKKSTRVDSESIENAEDLKNQISGQNIITGVSPDKQEEKEKQDTIIIASLPSSLPEEFKEEIKSDTKIIIEVKSEQNDNFAPIGSKEEFYKKNYYEALEEVNKLKDILKEQYEKNKILNDKVERFKEVNAYFIKKLNVLKNSNSDLELKNLFDELKDFLNTGKLPDKVNFFKNVI